MRLYRLCTLACAVFLLLSGCKGQPKTKEQLLSDGIKLLQEAKPGSATIAFKNALDKDPNYFEARLQLAKAYNTLGNFKFAEKELEKVRRQNPSSRDAKIEMARIMAYTKRPDDALKEIAEYLGDASADCDALQIAGFAHATKEDYPVAIALLNRATAACGESSTNPALLLSTVYLASGQTPAAEAKIKQIISKEPENRKALYMLAEIQLRRKDGEAAMKTFDQILHVQPADIEAQYRKGLLFLSNGDYDSALNIGRKLTKNVPERAEGHRLLGSAFFLKKQYNEAVAPLQKSLALEPNAWTYYILGLTHMYRSEAEQAMNQFQKALDLQPSLAVARLQLAQVFLNKKMVNDAISEAKKALAVEKENALAHNILGSAYLAKGDYADGIAELNVALRLDPSLADVHMKKGLVALKRGMGQEAESELAAVIRLKPEAQDARRLLALQYLNRNEPAKAIEVLQKGIQVGGSDPVAYYLMGDAYLRENKENEAKTYFTKAKEANPKYDLAYQRLAAIYFKQENQEQGVQELRSLLDHSPDNVQALLQLASLSEINGNESEARKNFLRAAETKKTEGVIAASQYFWRTNNIRKALSVVDDAITGDADLSLYELKGKILASDKRYREALTSFEAIERRNPQLGLDYVINTYLAMGDYAKALERVQAEIKKNPTSLYLRSELTKIQLQKGNKEEAMETARDIIRRTPGSAVGYLAVAMVHQSNNDIDKAIEVLKKAAGVQDPKLAIMLSSLYASKKNYPAALEQCRRVQNIKAVSEIVLFQMADMLQTMGRKKEAETEYLKLLQLSPSNVMALNNLAYLYGEEDRNVSQALQFATRAFMLAPGNDSVRDTLGYVFVRSGRVDQGVKILRKASENNPKNPLIYYHLGIAYQAGGDSAKAVENIQKALSLGDFPEAQEAKLLLKKIKKDGTS